MAGISGLGEGWDAMKVLDLYIYDYMKKNNMPQAAENFARETNILDDLPPAESLSSPSTVQLDNALQSMHQETPVVINEPAPLGADLDSTMMTWQQPAAHFLSANNYQLGDLRAAQAQAQAQAQANRQARIQAIAQARACQAQPQLQTGASTSNASSQLLQVLRMGAETQQQVPPRDYRHGVSLGTASNGASPGVNQQRSEADEGGN